MNLSIKKYAKAINRSETVVKRRIKEGKLKCLPVQKGARWVSHIDTDEYPAIREKKTVGRPKGS